MTVHELMKELCNAPNINDEVYAWLDGERIPVELVDYCSDQGVVDLNLGKKTKLKHFSVAVDRTIRMQVDVTAESEEEAEDKALEIAGSSKSYDKEWEDTDQLDEVIDVQEVEE